MKTELKEKILIADEIYNICMNELIRQISYYCLEQGELLMDIWKCYFLVFRKYFVLEHERREKLRQDNNEEYLKSIKVYREQINNRQREVNIRDEDLEKARGQIATLRREIDELQEKDKIMRNKLEMNRVLMGGLKNKCSKLLIENTEYALRLGKFKESELDNVLRDKLGEDRNHYNHHTEV